jgi:hypothetical protein
VIGQSAVSYSIESKKLAATLIRLYGKDGALKMAGRFATDCAAIGDIAGQNRWVAAAAWIAELIKIEELGEPKTS